MGTISDFKRMLPALCLLSLLGKVDAADLARKNLFTPYPSVTNPKEGMSWPKGQALPIFATPARTLDELLVENLSKDEQITFSALQGQVNRQQPRIYLANSRSDEGSDTWPNTATMGFGPRNRIAAGSQYELLAKYAKELKGVVLYDPKISPHYRNVAGTLAGVNRAVPATAEVYARMKGQGIELGVVADLTRETATSPVEIYQNLHDQVWPKCDKRIIVSARPTEGGGDFHHTRDMASACGAAVIWLDPRIPEEKDVLEKFLEDMKAGEAVALGWYASERSGITTLSAYGIGTLAADHFVSSTVFAGTDHRILVPKVPKKPELANKVYVSIFLSDGDNIQYTQHAMRKNWDRSAQTRGKIPLNWTIAPGLVDIAPGILNHYYTTTTEKDCFVTGPSGMGYLMPVNTLNEPGAPVGVTLTDPARMEAFARLTETYLQRSGLRVMTIWDDATAMQRKSYESHCRNLYGATVQNFKDVPSVEGGVEKGRLRFDKLVVPYAGSFNHLNGSLTREIDHWDGRSPLFLSYQVDVWGEMKPDRLVELHDKLAARYPGRIEFVRADHYFTLSNESNGLPFNLCLSPNTLVKSGDPAASPDALTDGTPTTIWSTSEKSGRWAGFEFVQPYKLTRCVIRHAGDAGLSPNLNTRDFLIQGSLDGKTWQTLDARKGNRDNVTDVEFPAFKARFVKITVQDAGADSTARFADVEIYGSKQ